MVLLTSLAVGFAIDAHKKRKKAEEQRLASLAEESAYETSLGSSDSNRKVEDDATFAEIQKYANFQSDLATRISTDMSRENLHDDYYSKASINKRKSQFFLGALPPPTFTSRPRLPYPIIIPLETSERGRGWSRTYSTSLMNCGIDQQTFLRFIDSFNKSLELSSSVQAINAASLISPTWEDSSIDISKILLEAAGLAKAVSKSSSFLDVANATTFSRHGLLAMALTYEPENNATIVFANTTLSSNPDTNQSRFSAASTLVNEEVDINKLRQIPTVIAPQQSRPVFRRTASRESFASVNSTNPRGQNSKGSPLFSLFSTAAKTRANKRDRKRKIQKEQQARPISRARRSVASSINFSELNLDSDMGFSNGLQPDPYDMEIDHDDDEEDEEFELEHGGIYLVIVNDPNIPLTAPPTPQPTTPWQMNDTTMYRNFEKERHNSTGTFGGNSFLTSLDVDDNKRASFAYSAEGSHDEGRGSRSPPSFAPGASSSYSNWVAENC